MDYRVLGKTGISVSRLCFGSLTIGPLQVKLSVEEGSRVLCEAFDRGVNFVDTAELYNTYPYIKEAIKGRRDKIVISSKCYAYTAEGAEKSLMNALNELDTDYVDFFSLHEQESELTIKGHFEALEYFVKAKEKGYIRGVGISTHAVGAVMAALKYKEIELIHPILNKKGLGIIDGSIEDMLDAVRRAYEAGKGIYAMKALGGGNLLSDKKSCFDFIIKNNNVHSIAVGMQSVSEVIYNTMIFNDQRIPDALDEELYNKKRKLLIDYWCTGCGKCCEVCGQGALSIIEGKAEVNTEKCVLCGYCSAYCKDFCIKII